MNEHEGEYPEDQILHVYGISTDLIPRINTYNNTHRQNRINITAICINALENALKKCEEGTA